MNRKCQQHKYNEYEFLHLKPTSAKEVLICSRCLDASQGKIKLIDCVGIKQILEANSQTILSKYPPLANSELNQMALYFSESIDGEIKQIKEYYQKLIRSFEAAVKNAMVKSTVQIDQLQQLRQSFMKKYAEIGQIEKLKLLVNQSLKDQNSDTQIHTFIIAISSEATANTNRIISQMNELQQYKESFSLEQPEKQQSNILKKIEEISFFNKKTNADNSSQSLILPKQNTQPISIINQITIKPASNLDKEYQPNIKRIDNTIQIKGISRGKQCTFESALNPKKKYIIALKPIIYDREKPEPCFSFGIMPFTLRHDEKLDNKAICYFFYHYSSTLYQMPKNNMLLDSQEYQDYQDTKMWNSSRFQNGGIEVLVNLENRIIKVRSRVIPQFELIAEVAKTFDLAKEYTFAILGNGFPCFITFEDICEVDSFEDFK